MRAIRVLDNKLVLSVFCRKDSDMIMIGVIESNQKVRPYRYHMDEMQEAKLRAVGLRAQDELDYYSRRSHMMEIQADKPDA
jgi:hypothetical protein